MIRALFHEFFEGWVWYDQLLFVIGIVFIILAILLVLFRGKIQVRNGKLEKTEDSEYDDLRKEQEGHEEQWLRPVIEWMDFDRDYLPKNQIMIRYQIDSGLIYEFKPYRMWVKLRIGQYESKDGWEIVQIPNLLKGKRTPFAGEVYTVNDDNLLKIIEECRQGLKIAQTLKVIMQLRQGEGLKVLESSYSINP